MLEENNIMAFLMAIFPVMIYSYLAFYLIPPTYIGIRRTKMYLVTGLLSPTIVYFFYFIFPYWDRPLGGTGMSGYVYQAFIQVALLEESAKFLTFWWVSSQRRNSQYDLPIATAYYCMMAAAGFAIIENIYYLISFGNDVLFIRGITAIILHMLCGFVMGYFIAKSRIIPSAKYPEPKNQQESLTNNLQRFGKKICAVFGIFVAAIIHGTYDLNLFLPYNMYPGMTLIIVLVSTLTIGYFMVKELIRCSNEIRERNMGRDIEAK